MTDPAIRGVLLILDGLGDRGQPGFDGATPLEAAHTPNMDRLLEAGQGGLMDPLFPGVPVGTHTGTGILLGIPPSDIVGLARGPIEAAGIGLQGPDGELLFRANLATIEERDGELHVLDRRAGRVSGEEVEELIGALGQIDLGNGVCARLHPATGHRAVLSLQGAGLSDRISDTDPGEIEGQAPLPPSRPLDASAEAAVTAAALNRATRLIHQRLREHPLNRRRHGAGLPPANGIVCRSPGTRRPARGLVRHLGLRAALVAGESTVIGLGHLLGLKVYSDPRFTSLPDSDLETKIAITLSALNDNQLVFVHIKGPDICAHDHDPAGKRALLERIDRAIAPLLERELVIGITGDHSTDCTSGRHTGDPVPALLSAPGGRRDHCRRFGEAECAGGGLGRLSGTGFLCSLLDAMGAMHKFQAGDLPLFAPP